MNQTGTQNWKMPVTYLKINIEKMNIALGKSLFILEI